MSSYRDVCQTGTVSNVADAIFALTELGEEIREMYDRSGENLQQSPRMITFDETASALEGISEPDVPSVVEDIIIHYNERQKKGRSFKQPSRAVRRDNAISILEAAQAAAEDWLDEEANQDVDERCDVDQFANDLEVIIDEIKDLEFPSMFG